MSMWSERVANHAAWSNLQALGPVIDQAIAREGIEPATIDALERIRAALTFIGKHLASLDPALVVPGPLDSMASSVQAATAEVQAFISDGAAGHAMNANTHADAALASLAGLVGYTQGGDLDSLSASALKYRSTLESVLSAAQSSARNLGSEVDAQRTKLNELANEMGAERQRLSTLVAEFQAQFSNAQENRNSEHASAQSTRQDRFSALVEQYSAQLSQQDTESARALETAIAAFNKGLDGLTAEYAAKATAVLGQIEDQRRSVEKLVGVIGNLGVTSGYLKTANRAQVSLWVWQAITVLALGGLIMVAYREFVPLVVGTFTWPSFAGRVFLSLTVGVLAAYAANQADKFLRIERANRKLALELEALGPFLAPLPTEKQEAFRLSVGERSFRGDTGDDAASTPSPATVLDVIAKSKETRSFLTDLVKVIRSG